MSRFVSFETHKLELGMTKYGPEWLSIRDKLSYFEKQHLNSAMLDVDVSSDGDTTIKADPGRYTPAILETYIVGWQLFDDEGNHVLFNKEMVGRLDDNTCEAAIEHINEMTKSQDEEKKPRVIEGVLI